MTDHTSPAPTSRRPLPRHTSHIIGLLALASVATAQGPATLTTDIAPTTTERGVPIVRLGVAGATLYLGMNGGDGLGDELWRSDGTQAGTVIVKDINPGSASSTPLGIVQLGADVLFAADDGVRGRELWKSDGTPAGTVLLADIEPGAAGSNPVPQVVVNGVAVFVAMTQTAGSEPWRTDGTVAGTFRLADINAGSGSSGVRNLTVAGSQAFFVADNGTNGEELWATDGTVAGTRLVRDINPGAGESFITSFAALGSRVAFGALHATAGIELWVSDGTAAGTTLVADIAPGADSSLPENFASFQGRVFFSASTLAAGAELWVSDGTAAGTAMVADLNLTGSSSPSPLAAGNRLFLVGSLGSSRLLGVSDGTTAGTRFVSTTYQSIGTIAALGDDVVFSGQSFGSRVVAWSDGTAVAPLHTSPAATPPTVYSPAYNGAVVFTGYNAGGTPQLWRTSGTFPTTTQFFVPSAGASSDPVSVVDAERLSHKVFFSADDGVLGREPWTSDGTAAGTFMLRDIHPTGGSMATLPPATIAMLGGRAFFAADDDVNGTELWSSDGTTAGTNLVADINPGNASSSPAGLTVYNGKVYFAAAGPGVGYELWASDGTAAGTTLVHDINAGAAGSQPTNLIVFRGMLYFGASNGTNGTELWRTDGTAAGTTMVIDLVPGTASGFFNQPTLFGDMILFVASPSSTGAEPYRTDGTAAGTALLRDIQTAGSSNPRYLGVANNRMFFAATQTATGEELWRTDGTTAGTVLVRDIRSGSSGSALAGFADIAGTAVFVADDGVAGLELWKSDGSTAGTTMVVDLLPGAPPGVLAPGFVHQPGGADRALFPGRTADSGFELFVTDGTAAGTVLHQDLDVGPRSSNPGRPVLAGCRLFFPALTFATGRELFSMPSMAVAAPFGVGCPGTNGTTPRIKGTGGAPRLGNANFGVRVENGLASSTTVMTLQFLRAEIPLGRRCFFYGDPASQVLVVGTALDGSGAGTITLPVPNDINLVCLQLFAQNVIVDPAGLFLNSLSLTPALKMVLAPN